MSEQNASQSELNNDKINKNNSVNKTNYINSKKDNEKKRRSDLEINPMPKHLKNNYWSVLDNDNNCNKDLLQKFETYIQEKERPSSSTNVPTNTTAVNKNIINNENKTNQQNKIKKMPPLNIYDVEPKNLIEFIKDGLNISDFKIKEVNNNKMSLYTSTADDYFRIKAYLEKTKTRFYSFTPKDVKTKSYLLKGLSANIEPNEILEELKKFENENLNFLKVKPFYTKRTTNSGQTLPIYMIQISEESKPNELKSIKSLLYRCVRWEALKKTRNNSMQKLSTFFP
ncbi:hypothetical protein CVS40_11917 [Lucilia cuprina]|nr:hypothetical protein CVS40_11917 [Lucilia cuprina]